MNTTGWQTTRRAALFLCAALFLFTGCKDLFHPEGPPPSAPSGVTASAQSSSSIKITWKNVSDAREYYIYWATSNDGPYQRTSTNSTSYTDTGLQPNTTYYYKVSARDKEDREGSHSSVVSAKTLLRAPPGFTVTAESPNSIRIRWDSVPGASGYRVYWARNNYETESLLTSTNNTYYEDYNVSSNTTYYYKVSAYDSSNREGAKTESKSVTTSPSAPSGLYATAQSSSSIEISWNPVAGANGYRVYRADSSDGTYSQIGSTYSTTFYNDIDLPSGATYYYKVSAYSNNSGESPQSSVVFATTSLPEPLNIVATAQSSSSITISWNPVAGATGYYIYRSGSAYGTYTKVLGTNITSTSYTNTGLTAETPYYYKVTAYNSNTESPLSSYNYAYATTDGIAPSTAPSGVSATAQSSNSISISWNSVVGAESYRVYRASSNNGPYSQVSSTYSYSTYYLDTGLSSGATYYYKVSAYNTWGEAESSVVFATTLLPAPSSIVATAQSSSSIEISWSSVVNATGYNIHRASSDGGTYSKVGSTTSGNATSYTNTGLTAETTYYYKVTAYNSNTESPLSSYNYAYATTDGIAPSTAPSGVSATAQSSNSISISWNSVAGAESYRVYRADRSGGTYSQVGSPYSYSTYYLDTGLSSGATYYYKVSAYNTWGEAESNPVSATTYPATPTGVSATAQSSNSITISWTAVTGATGYYVYRSDSTYGTYTKIPDTNITTTSYTDTGLTADTTYYYKVSAYNSSGESSPSSSENAKTNATP